MSCKVEVSDSKVYQALKKKFGTDESKAFSIWLKVVKDEEFTSDFQKWQKEKRKTDNVVTLETADIKTIVTDMVQYYNRKNPDGNDTIRDRKTRLSRGYNSVADRNFCQRTVANEMLDIFRDHHYAKFDSKRLTQDDYKKAVITQFAKRLLDRLQITQEELRTKINKQRFINLMSGYINQGEPKAIAQFLAMHAETINIAKDILGKNINTQDSNFLATFEEMINSTKDDKGVKISDNFFNEVFRDSRLDEIRRETKDEFNTAEEDAAQITEDVALGETTSEDDNFVNDSFDISFRVFDSHDGQYATFTTHIGGNIRSYLNSLRKLKGTGEVNGNRYYDTDNAIGIADTMSANECAMILYTQGNYNNVESMIQSIYRIAEQVPGFEAFVQFAEDLKANYDFAYEVYRTFGKMVIGKRETYIENGEIKTRLSNNTSSKVDALRFEYMNALRSSSIETQEYFAAPEAQKVLDKINDVKKGITRGRKFDSTTKKNIDYSADSLQYKIDKKDIIASLTENFKRYIPTIESSVILNYINNNKKDGIVDELYNMSTLYNHLTNIIRSSHETYINYTSRQADAAAIRRENNKLIQRMTEGEYIPKSRLKDPLEVWNQDFLSKESEQAAIQLANIFAPYSLVKTELNSRNAKGNLSSDVINSSMITNLMNILQSDLNNSNEENTPLNNYAAYKFRGKQYNLSNILVEKEENGEIINYGLFKLVDGKYIKTPYATELIKLSLFNGISDFGNGKSALYSEMSQGDYIATAMANYFKSEHSVADIEFADYFMRIPSDAPKNFMFTAPKYSLDFRSKGKRISFWQIENEGQVNTRIRELINSIPHKDADEYKEITLDSQEDSNGKKVLSAKQVARLLEGKKLENIAITTRTALYVEKDSLIGYLTLNTNGVDFIVKGTLNKEKTELSNVELHGVINNIGQNVAYNSEITSLLTDYYRTELIRGNIKLTDGTKVKRNINHQHPIFKQMLSVFKQEMKNAATAIDKIFNHTNGQIAIVNGEILYSDDFSQLANPDRATYANYHRKDNTYVDKNGIEHKEKGIIQNIWRPVTDENGKVLYYEKTNMKRLSGNVFTTDRFTIFDEDNKIKRNFLAEVLSEDRATEEDGKIHILYGGANTHLHINSNGDVEFTAAQQKLIENKIEEFIKAYVDDSIRRTKKFSNLLEGIPHTDDNITEFILNYRLAYINCNDLFEGDSKFYKSTQDFLKRSKETQGSGVPYGIVDFTRPMFGQQFVEIPESYLNSPEMQAIVGKLHNCKQFTTFRGVTVTNTIRTSIESQTLLVDQLTNNFIKEGIKEDVARDKAESMMNGYKNTKVNDAQSYITFEEWIRRISARGQLHKYKPLIEAILDESKPLNVQDINEFVQVQKNFYYDQYYDETTGVMAPRQIKNAEFVLVPRLIKGTELEAIYNCMVHYGIDQLNTEETSKAGKANVLTLWDKDGNLTKEWLQDFNSNIQGAIEIYDYNYLYTQQETPQHVNAENKAGIQIMKKIIDNIDENSPKEIWEAKQRFLENYSQNIYDSFSKLMTELNVTFDEDGNIITDEYGNINGIDYNVFLNKLKDEMMRLGLDSNMLDFVTLKDTPVEDKSGQNGFGLQTKMPAFLNANRRKLESVSQAIFNNSITRQKLPGFHAAQITQIGFKPLRNQVTNHSYSKQLRYHPDGKRYIEVMLPASNFGLNRDDEMWRDLYNNYVAQGLSVEEIEAKIDQAMLDYIKEKGLDTFIGYRIPTEGKQSVCVMKVVGFTPDAYGSTIVVPDDWVAQTGSDFDIDSIYGIQYSVTKTRKSIDKIQYSTDVKENYVNYVLNHLNKDDKKELRGHKKDEIFDYAKEYAKDNSLMTFEKYQEQPISAQNSREARNNQILDDMIKILQSDAALEENLSQSQFTDVIKARDKVMSKIDKARRDARSPYDFFDQAEYQEDAMSGAKLKAFSVTLDTFCSICNTVKPVLAKSINIVYKGDDAKFKELQARFDSKNEKGEWVGKVSKLKEGKILVRHTCLGYSNDNKNVVGKILTAYSSQTTAHILDAIKEGAIQNVNDLTFAVYKLFPNIGSDYETAVSFMMQPGISAIVNAYNRNKSIYAKGYENPINTAIKNIAKELHIGGKNSTITTITEELEKKLIVEGMRDINILDSSLLTDRINNQGITANSPVKELLFDYLVVKKYQELSTIAGKIGALTRVTNPDKFGAKQTIYATNKVFDDILDILADDNPVFAKVNGKHFLDKIYPDIESIKNGGIEAYMSSKRNDSAYPPLHYFLKYSTAPSIKINRQLFVTQRIGFRNAVNAIKQVMSGNNPRVSEETYNSFEKYILSSLYNDVEIISKPVHYVKGKGIQVIEGDIMDEKARIFGYGYEPDLKVDDGNGNRVSFNPVDINKLTKEEIDLFAKFTPAQKVYWIQQNFRDGLICKYLKTNLVNSREYRRNKAGAQTIEFIEDGVDRESMYELFRNTYCNTNPLLVMTAMDIIKYAFVVEGFDMKRGAVNKIIDNDILTEDKGFYGTGIESALCDIVGMFGDNPDMTRVDQLTEDFVRSHSNMSEISHTWISKDERKQYFNSIPNGVITLFNNNVTEEFITNHNLGYIVEYDTEIPVVDENGNTIGSKSEHHKEINFNKYIKINYTKTDETLYKIVKSRFSNVVYLFPLNLLQESEVGMWSANISNNKYMPSEYYSDVIDEYEEKHDTWDINNLITHTKTESQIDTSKYQKPQKAKGKEDITPVDFDINDTSINGISILRTAIENHFNGTTSEMLILESLFLQDHIKGVGIDNGIKKVLNGNAYYIYKLNTSNLYKYTSEKGLDREIPVQDKPFAELIERARLRGIESGHPGQSHVYNAFAVVPYAGTKITLNDEDRGSSITETVAKADKAIRRKAYNEGNVEAENYVKQTNSRNIESTNKSVTSNLDDVVISTSEYVKTAVDKILDGENGLHLFTQDPETGSYLAITDPKVIELIKADPGLRRKYLKTLLEAKHLIDTFESFNTFKFNDDNAHLKYYVDKINESIKKLSDSTILEEAEQLYVTGYLASITNNPNIKNNIISLLDGFHTTSYLTSYINDLQDTSNPIIQIITNDVMSDIRAKEFQGEQRVREFKKFMRDIKSEAAKQGHTINWDNIVDENGKFINDYNEQFISDLETYRSAKDEAYTEYKNTEDEYDKSVAFEKYLQAKLAYDKWKLENTNQELVNDYYRQMIEAEESMINTDTGKFTDIYVQYKMLNDRLRDVFSHTDNNGNLDEHFEQEKKNILEALANLKSDAIKTPTGEFIYKRDLEEYELADPTTNPRLRRNQNINSASAAVRLRNFVDKRNQLNDEYYNRTERFGFKEQLNRYLDVIKKYERRNLTEDDLEEIPEYVTAKNWVKHNATYQYSLYKTKGIELSKNDVADYLEEYYDGKFDPNTQDFDIRVQAALNYLSNIRGERNNKSAIYKRIAKKNDARDENGVIDARKFTKEEIAAIKKEQEARFGIGESVAFSERSIIHTSSSDDTIYTDAFYKGMKIEGLSNSEYLKIVNGYDYEEDGQTRHKDGINDVLRRCLNPSTGVLETSKLSIEEINYILDLFAKLGYNRTEQTFNTKDGVSKYKGVKRKQVKEVLDFIDKNVEFVLTEEDKRRFEAEKANALLDRGDAYYYAWMEMNQEWSEEKQEFVPNHLLWGHAQPKSSLSKEERDKFISKKMTAAVNILNKVFTEKPTKYYELERSKMANTYGVNSYEYKEWMKDNHVYNPHTHKLEPLTCWTSSEPNDNMPGQWEPTYQMTDKGVKTEYANKNYRKGLGVAANYKSSANNKYKRINKLNEQERKVKEHVQELLAGLATTKRAKQYIENGNLPTRAIKEDKSFSQIWLKELAKGFGYIEGNSGYERWDSDVKYDTDYVPDMPMLSQLRNKDSHKEPYREMFNSDAEYAEALKQYKEHKEEYDKENAKIHRDILDHNWEDVISEFITKATHYNAIQDNKYQLYFGQKLLNDILIYQTRNSTSSKLSRDSSLSSESETVYKKGEDKNLQGQYTNWVRRVIFDQYKENQGRKTRFMTILQSITSTNYMTLNVRGGIANVLVGEANIWGEVFAKEYFGKKEWAIGKQIWTSGLASYARNMYSDTSTSLADAIIKGMKIVDYDEITGRVTQANLEEWSKRIRDAAFSPQTIGEHFMQNGAMFSMMMSHRVVSNPKYGQPGEPKYTFMNKEEYLAESMNVALNEILSDEEKAQYKAYIEGIREDANVAKDYALYRKNHITNFVMTRLSNEKQLKYIEAEKKYREINEKEFLKNPTVYSQFKLGDDGKMDFADNSLLAEMNVLRDKQEVTDAYKLLGKFKGRVISVNKKIHGNYGKLDAARIESQWWGSLIMQYHKHIYPGIMKRYRTQGYWNEERGTVEKGSYVALYDFLTMPIKQIAERNRLSEGQTETLTGIQNMFSMVTEYLHYIKLGWKTMPEYERANVRRNLGDIAGMLTSVMMALLLRLGFDDDDESIAFNLGLYEADRLATECFMWNPIGMYAEAKKLWSSPVAAQSIISDCLNIMGTTAGIIFEGEDYDPYFRSGRYAGQHKLGVYVERRIPYWRNWVALRDIADNNHYYKMGDNILSVINVKDIANEIKGK